MQGTWVPCKAVLSVVRWRWPPGRTHAPDADGGIAAYSGLKELEEPPLVR